MLNKVSAMLDAPASRRQTLKGGLFGIVGALAAPVVANATSLAMPNVGGFDIAFRNVNTGESFSGTYRVGNKYLPDAFEEINSVLRDYRYNEVFPIDPRLIDILYLVDLKTGSKKPYDILSGYRSPNTNSMLSHASNGVAKNSLHMTGQAIDVRLPSFSTRKLKDLGVALRAGGVGYYPKSNFVHLDTGRVRQW